MSISHEQIDDYLTRYAATMTDLDAESAADLWTTPGLIADDRFSGVLESREAMVQGLKQSYPLYQKLGLHSVGYELLDQNHLTGLLVLIRVRWSSSTPPVSCSQTAPPTTCFAARKQASARPSVCRLTMPRNSKLSLHHAASS